MRSAEPGALGDAGGGGELGRRDLAYLASIPFSVRAFRTLRRKAEALQRGAEGDAMGEAEGPPAD